MIADDDYKTKWYASNKALHAAWERAEKAETERDALQETIRRLQNRVDELEDDRKDHHIALQSVLFRNWNTLND